MNTRKRNRKGRLVASLIAIAMTCQEAGVGQANAADSEEVTVIRFMNSRGNVAIYEIAGRSGEPGIKLSWR